MTDTLPTRLLAAVRQRMATAGSATSGPWNNDDPMSSDGVYAPAVDGYVADCNYERMGPFAVANAAHIAANDPATVLRHCERDMRVLERHAEDDGYCNACCVPFVVGEVQEATWPCAEISDLCTAYGIEVDG